MTTEPPAKTTTAEPRKEKVEKVEEDKQKKESAEDVKKKEDKAANTQQKESKANEVKKEETPKKTDAEQKEKTVDQIVKAIIYDEVGKKTNMGEKRIIELQVNDNMGTDDTNDKIVIAKLYADDGFSNDSIRKKILMNSKDLFETLFKRKEISEVVLLWQFSMVDAYGKESVDTILKVGLDHETADKINWKNFDYNNFELVATQYYTHPALLKE
ncbi:hypothetical protein [Anoxybacillus pushchinoensis]|uniref:Uncharacterized protein n=1 Tax=Anoxybacillus pushchinoensis TaxID=150248 RepID=A0A1I0TZ80_9BACL|nr:hypothetical protein [Anoxybacillus pushchinoensis]SFA56970.1 hypothetical protein SAMN05216169_10598 [Anoxybacillus pushchinoensis]